MTNEKETPSGFRGFCKYKSGKCNRQRALKHNGKPHTLCEFHRQRQQENQRRLLKRRRMRLQKEEEEAARKSSRRKAARLKLNIDAATAAAAAAAAAAAVDDPAASINSFTVLDQSSPLARPSLNQFSFSPRPGFTLSPLDSAAQAAAAAVNPPHPTYDINSEMMPVTPLSGGTVYQSKVGATTVPYLSSTLPMTSALTSSAEVLSSASGGKSGELIMGPHRAFTQANWSNGLPSSSSAPNNFDKSLLTSAGLSSPPRQVITGPVISPESKTGYDPNVEVFLSQSPPEGPCWPYLNEGDLPARGISPLDFRRAATPLSQVFGTEDFEALCTSLNDDFLVDLKSIGDNGGQNRGGRIKRVNSRNLLGASNGDSLNESRARRTGEREESQLDDLSFGEFGATTSSENSNDENDNSTCNTSTLKRCRSSDSSDENGFFGFKSGYPPHNSSETRPSSGTQNTDSSADQKRGGTGKSTGSSYQQRYNRDLVSKSLVNASTTLSKTPEWNGLLEGRSHGYLGGIPRTCRGNVDPPEIDLNRKLSKRNIFMGDEGSSGLTPTPKTYVGQLPNQHRLGTHSEKNVPWASPPLTLASS